MYLVVPAAVALPITVLAMISLFSRRPANLGVIAGQLAPCPDSPNCVATQSGNSAQRMTAWPYRGSPQEAMGRLKEVVGALPRTRIIEATDHYLHAEFTSAVFRFVDDVEFLIDPATQVIHFRSASRVGYSDLGANRRRMEEVRRRWEE